MTSLFLAPLLILVTLLAGCGGGGGSAATAPALPPQQPAASVPSVPDVPTPPASAPVSAPSFNEVAFRDPWDSISVSGWIWRGADKCAGEADPLPQHDERSFSVAGSWVPYGTPGGLRAEGGNLLIDDNTATGWGLLSPVSLDHTRPIRMSAPLEVLPVEGSWVHFTLWSGENDYRGMSLSRHDGQVWAIKWAPCHSPWLGTVAPGKRLVTIDYTPPPAEVCWRYYIDSVQIHSERCDDRGAPLMSRPRAGIWAGNTHAGGGRVWAIVGPMTVWQGE